MDRLIKGKPLDNIEFTPVFKRYSDTVTGGGDAVGSDAIKAQVAVRAAPLACAVRARNSLLPLPFPPRLGALLPRAADASPGLGAVAPPVPASSAWPHLCPAAHAPTRQLIPPPPNPTHPPTKKIRRGVTPPQAQGSKPAAKAAASAAPGGPRKAAAAAQRPPRGVAPSASQAKELQALRSTWPSSRCRPTCSRRSATFTTPSCATSRSSPRPSAWLAPLVAALEVLADGEESVLDETMAGLEEACKASKAGAEAAGVDAGGKGPPRPPPPPPAAAEGRARRPRPRSPPASARQHHARGPPSRR